VRWQRCKAYCSQDGGASLSRRQLTRQMITDLKMRNGSVRQLKFEP
jgi:hypothetical protein